MYNRCNKNCIKKSNWKTSQTNGDVVANTIADKITSVSKKKSAKELQNKETEVDVERATPKKNYISPEER